MPQWPPPQENYPDKNTPNTDPDTRPKKDTSDSDYYKGYHDGVEAARKQNIPGSAFSNDGSWTGNNINNAWPNNLSDRDKKVKRRNENLEFVRKVGITIIVGILLVICIISFIKTGINPSIPSP